MSRVLLALALLAALAAQAEAIAWEHARWYDGRGFARGTRYTVDGVFVAREPAKLDRIVDLRGGWVVPAYGDAHHHGIDSSDAIEDKVTVFLEAGIFYVKNPNAIPELITPEVRAKLDRPGSIGVTFANAGITSPGGHPAPLYRYLAELGVFPGFGPADMEGHAYFLVPDEASLDALWPRILASRPDFIKTFLLFSEEFDGVPPLKRETDGEPNRGLHPRVLAAVVRKAHAAGLRVSTHVDTARDFENAVDAGVDEVNHLPQPDPRFSADLSAYVIGPAVAARAAARGITVVTTASTTERVSPSIPVAWRPAMRDNQRANLQTLLAAGVKVAIGSDGIQGERRFVTARDEVRFLREHGLMTPAQILRAWSVDTPRAIFPNRRVGGLAPGDEADFIVLDDDPRLDSENLHRILRRVQAGRELPGMPSFRLVR